MLEPFIIAFSRAEKKSKFSIPSWFGWELVIVLVLLCFAMWYSSDTAHAFFSGSWGPSTWKLI